MNKRNIILIISILLIVVISTTAFSACTAGRTLVVPRGWPGAITDNMTLYIGTMEGNISSVSMENGSLIWTAPLEEIQESSGFLGCSQAASGVAIYGSPSLYKDRIYIGGYNGKVYAFDPGQEKPRVYPNQDDISGSIVGSVIVIDEMIYTAATDGKVYAIDIADGISKELLQTEDKIWSTPTISDGVLYIGSFDNKLYAIDAEDGTKKWEFLTEGAIVSQAVVYDGSVIVGSFDRNLYSVDIDTGKENWRFQADNWFWATPIVHNGTLYSSCLNGKIYAINPSTGKVLTEFDLGSPVSSSPVMIDDLLVAVATQETPAESRIYTIDTSDNQQRLVVTLDEKVYSSLASSGDNVYVHTSNDVLYEINTVSGTKREMTIKIAEEEE